MDLQLNIFKKCQVDCFLSNLAEVKKRCPNIYGPDCTPLLVLYLDGKPAAEIRTVSRMPHARSCCMVLTGSILNGKELTIEYLKQLNRCADEERDSLALT